MTMATSFISYVTTTDARLALFPLNQIRKGDSFYFVLPQGGAAVYTVDRMGKMLHLRAYNSLAKQTYNVLSLGWALFIDAYDQGEIVRVLPRTQTAAAVWKIEGILLNRHLAGC